MLTFFFFNDTATTEIYTLSLHDALPISAGGARAHGAEPVRRRGLSLGRRGDARRARLRRAADRRHGGRAGRHVSRRRSEEHTSELQSRQYLVCRLLLDKNKSKTSSSSPL